MMNCTNLEAITLFGFLHYMGVVITGGILGGICYIGAMAIYHYVKGKIKAANDG